MWALATRCRRLASAPVSNATSTNARCTESGRADRVGELLEHPCSRFPAPHTSSAVLWLPTTGDPCGGHTSLSQDPRSHSTTCRRVLFLFTTILRSRSLGVSRPMARAASSSRTCARARTCSTSRRRAASCEWSTPGRRKSSTGALLKMTIRLARAGAIDGRIQDEQGDGLDGVEVHGIRRINVHGHITLQTVGMPQRRTIAATSVCSACLRASTTCSPRTHAGVLNAILCRARVLRTRTSLVQPEIGGARPVVVRAGQVSEGVNFAPAPCRLATLTVRGMDSRGVPAKWSRWDNRASSCPSCRYS